MKYQVNYFLNFLHEKKAQRRFVLNGEKTNEILPEFGENFRLKPRNQHNRINKKGEIR